MKVNFEAAWDEVGDEFEKEETFTLSTIKTLEGKMLVILSLIWLLFRTLSYYTTATSCLPSSHQNSWPYLEHLCCVVDCGWAWGSMGKCRLSKGEAQD